MRISRPWNWFWSEKELDLLRAEIATLDRAVQALRTATAVTAARARIAAADVNPRDPRVELATAASVTDIQDAARKRRVKAANPSAQSRPR